jgi:purine-binding chemotaxis protein CheW
LEVETVTSESLQVISFTLENESNKKKENYAVPIEQIREIRTIENITKIPKAKSHVKGVMNLRGMIIPVIDIKKRLGFGTTDDLDKKRRILVADVRDSIYGLIVDKVDQVFQLSVKDVEPVPPDTFESHHYIKGIAKIDGKLIVLLDIIGLFEDVEQDSEELLTDQYENQDSANNKTTKEKTTKNNDIEKKVTTEDDIPEELKEVFKEDEMGISLQKNSE